MTNPNSGTTHSSAIRTAGFSITPSDTTDLVTFTSGLWVSAAGTVQADFVDGAVNVPLGTLGVGFYPLGLRRIRATGTTATLIGMY